MHGALCSDLLPSRVAGAFSKAMPLANCGATPLGRAASKCFPLSGRFDAIDQVLERKRVLWLEGVLHSADQLELGIDGAWVTNFE